MSYYPINIVKSKDLIINSNEIINGTLQANEIDLISGGNLDLSSLSIDDTEFIDSSKNIKNVNSLLVGGATINSSSLVQFDSTTKGVLLPRMNQTQKLAIVNPFAGLTVYDTTLNCLSYHNGTNWFIPSWLNFATSLTTQCVASPGAIVVWNTFSNSPDDRITSITGSNFTIKDIGRYEINVCFNWSQANADGSEARAQATFGYYQGAVLAVSTDQVIVTDGITCSGSATMTYFLNNTIENESYEFRTYSNSGGTASQFCELGSSSTGYIRRIL
jgi:hypothetical protein